EERAGLEVGDERVVHVEQQPEPIAFPRQLLLRALGGLVMQGVVDGERHLAGQLQQERDVGSPKGVFLAAGEDEPTETAERRGEREDAERLHPVSTKALRDEGEAR